MNIVFYLSAAIAVLASALAVTRLNPMHALLYLIVSLLAVGMVFFSLGAPFAGALEAIVYAGAILVLFIFAIMLLNLGPQSAAQESRWLGPRSWAAPAVLTVILLAELMYVFIGQAGGTTGGAYIGSKALGSALFSTYLIGVELASILLLAALVGAYHLGARRRERLAERETRQIAAISAAFRPGAGPGEGDGRAEAGSRKEEGEMGGELWRRSR